MPSTLKQNLTSSYLDAAGRLSPKKKRRQVVAYVESYDDVAFWRTLLAEFETDELCFRVMLPSNQTLAKGKKTVLLNTLNTKQLGRSLIACVDSDYDFLLQGATRTSHDICSNPFVLQTYAYAIENYLCTADSLHEVCVRSTLNDRHTIDFPDFMRRYSETVYPLFVWNVWFYSRHDTDTFPMHELHELTRIREFNAKQPNMAIQDVGRSVQQKLTELRREHGQSRPQVQKLASDLTRLGLTPERTYLYMQGHHIMDNVVLRVLTPICTQLRREREEEIRRLALHDEQLKNELAGYDNSIAPVAMMLKKNENYKDLYLYQWMRQDVQDLLARCK